MYERVEELSEKRNEKLNRLKLVEDDLKASRKPMQEAVHFLETENTLTHNKNFLYQKAM